jgi:hypothetical protein
MFDSHRPLHFQPSLANASHPDLQLTTGGTLVDIGYRWPWFHTQSCTYDRVDPLPTLVTDRFEVAILDL